KRNVCWSCAINAPIACRTIGRARRLADRISWVIASRLARVYACGLAPRTLQTDEGGPYVSATPQGGASRHQAREHAGAGFALPRRSQHAVGTDQVRGDSDQGAL